MLTKFTDIPEKFLRHIIYRQIINLSNSIISPASPINFSNNFQSHGNLKLMARKWKTAKSFEKYVYDFIV